MKASSIPKAASFALYMLPFYQCLSSSTYTSKTVNTQQAAPYMVSSLGPGVSCFIFLTPALSAVATQKLEWMIATGFQFVIYTF